MAPYDSCKTPFVNRTFPYLTSQPQVRLVEDRSQSGYFFAEVIDGQRPEGGSPRRVSKGCRDEGTPDQSCVTFEMLRIDLETEEDQAWDMHSRLKQREEADKFLGIDQGDSDELCH